TEDCWCIHSRRLSHPFRARSSNRDASHVALLSRAGTLPHWQHSLSTLYARSALALSHRGDRLAHRIRWPMLDARPVRRIGVAAGGPLREKTLFPGRLHIVEGEGVDVDACGVHAPTAEGAYVTSG